MIIKTNRAEIRDIPSCTILLSTGDHVSMAVEGVSGSHRIISVSVQGSTVRVKDEATGNVLQVYTMMGV